MNPEQLRTTGRAFAAVGLATAVIGTAVLSARVLFVCVALLAFISSAIVAWALNRRPRVRCGLEGDQQANKATSQPWRFPYYLAASTAIFAALVALAIDKLGSADRPFDIGALWLGIYVGQSTAIGLWLKRSAENAEAGAA